MTTNEPNHNALYVPKTASRRDFLRGSVLTGAGLALGAASTNAFAAGNDEIKIGLIGCGGRGSGACGQALSTGNKNFVLWAMGDAHKDRLDSSYSLLSNKHTDQVKVADERKFVGLDAYEKVLKECDLVILATPPGFRAYHFEASVNAGKNIFMEKPVATDAAGVRKVLEMAKVADQKGLKVVAGLQRRYQNCYIEALKQVKEHDIIGDITGGNIYWNDAGVWVKERLPGMTEMEYQLLNWYYFAWLCGDHIVEQHIHNIDVANWFIGSHPLGARGMGGRQVRTDKKFGEIFDHHAVEFLYPNGVIINSQCRHQKNCYHAVREQFTGTKGILYLENNGKCYAEDYKGNRIWNYQLDANGKRKRDVKDPDPYQVDTAVTVLPDEAHNAISPDAKNRQGAVDHLKRVLECAHNAGVQVLCGPYYQVLGQFTGAFPTEEELDRAAAVHREISPVAEAAGVKLAIEALNRFESHLLNTMAQAASYVKRVNHPNFGTMFDTFHANIEEKDTIAAIDTVYNTGRLHHVHISENDRGTPGKGHAAIIPAINKLKSVGYDKWLTIEAFGSALPDLAAATRVWRDFFPSTDEVYKEGYKLIRNAWDAA